jgi:DNA-binding response OmpR family regulator
LDPWNEFRVLIVEDLDDQRRALAIQLRGHGFTVDEAADGEQGWRLVQARPPDCIILDLMMPVMDGFSFLKRVRSRNASAAVPLIVLTASGDGRHPRRSEQYLADAYIRKPYELADLLDVISVLCGRTVP